MLSLIGMRREGFSRYYIEGEKNKDMITNLGSNHEDGGGLMAPRLRPTVARRQMMPHNFESSDSAWPPQSFLEAGGKNWFIF